MRIAIVWKDDYPWDVRVEKIGKTLTSFGHEVHIIARNLRRERAEENSNGIIIHRLKPMGPARLNNMFSIPAFFNPIWLSKIHNVCKRNKIDIIIVRDLPLVVDGVVIAKKMGIPVIFDMAELYSAMWTDLNRIGQFKIANYIMKNPLFGKYLEKYSVRSVDHTLVVVEEARSALIELGADSKKISIVSNTPDLKEIERLQAAHQHLRWKDKIVLFYHGYINTGRGLDAVIRSMPELIKRFKNLHLVLIGSGEGIVPFKGLSKELGIEQHVEFAGWLKFDQIPSMIKQADICIIPHLATEHKNTTIPNKLFDYMACSKPVIVSDAKPLKRIVEEEKCGLVFESAKVDSLVDVVSRMISNLSVAKKMGENGLKAAKRKYNWEFDSMALKNAIERFAK